LSCTAATVLLGTKLIPKCFPARQAELASR